MVTKENIEAYFRQLQDSICQQLELADGKVKYLEDKWEHEAGGGGRTRVFQGGNILEKGGVNFSAVSGPTSQQLIDHFNLKIPLEFFATGVSIVLHPESPMVPIIHMNVRYFELSNGEFWFGGGIDLTPIYVDTKQAQWFHQQLKNVCDQHDILYYSKFKNWADDYFYIPFRNETRGVGGIFFDYLKPDENKSKLNLFDFVKSVGDVFGFIYTHLMKQNSDLPYTENEKNWQLIRRGRYAEFNLAIDRGTKFGLETNGRTESILMSLPPLTAWKYDYQPVAGSLEAETQNLLKKNIDWLNI